MSTTFSRIVTRWVGDRNEIIEVIRMSFPIVVANCCRMLMDVSDYWMISRTGDTDALAAILPGQMIMFCYIVIGLGMVSIITTLASQSLGRGDRRSCSAFAWQGLYLSLALWLIGGLLWPFLPAVIGWAGHDSAIQDLEKQYITIAYWTVGPTIINAALCAFFNGIHRPMVTMVTALEGLLVNAGASYVLIFGSFGLPAMGVAGAAWGLVIGTSYRAVRLVWCLCGSEMDREFQSRSTWRLDVQKILKIVRVGGPCGWQWCSDVIVWATFTVVLVGSYFGKTHQLATNAAWQYLRVSFIPCMGVGMAICSLVGRSIGAGDPLRAVRLTHVCTVLMLCYMIAMSLIYFIWRNELVGFFCADADVIRIGALVMVCAAVFQVFDALMMGYSNALRGAGDTLVPSIVFAVSHWIVVIGGGFAMAELRPDLGSLGPWIAASVLIILSGIWFCRRWSRRDWMKIDLFRDPAEHPAAANETSRDSVIPGTTGEQPA